MTHIIGKVPGVLHHRLSVFRECHATVIFPVLNIKTHFSILKKNEKK